MGCFRLYAQKSSLEWLRAKDYLRLHKYISWKFLSALGQLGNVLFDVAFAMTFDPQKFFFNFKVFLEICNQKY